MLLTTITPEMGIGIHLEQMLVHADDIGDWWSALALLEGPACGCLLRAAQRESQN